VPADGTGAANFARSGGLGTSPFYGQLSDKPHELVYANANGDAPRHTQQGVEKKAASFGSHLMSTKLTLMLSDGRLVRFSQVRRITVTHRWDRLRNAILLSNASRLEKGRPGEGDHFLDF
jgi:hypothetical protein